MKILALEFSSHERSIALLDDAAVLGSAVDHNPKATQVFDSITRLLSQGQLEPGQVECIAVGLGPGSYGGIRTAISIAQGWQVARGVKLIGVSSADAIARKLGSAEGSRLLEKQTSYCGIVNIVFDAQRNESYAIRYRIDAQEPHALGSFDLLSTAEESRRREAGEVFIKADSGPWKLGAVPILLPDGQMVGAMAAVRTDYVFGQELEPLYLRQAEFVKAPSSRFSAV